MIATTLCQARTRCRILWLFTLALLTGIAWGQAPAILGGTYQRYGILSINTHGARISPQLLHYLDREGRLLLIKNRALGFQSPKNFYYKIDFLPDRTSYQRYTESIGMSSSNGGITIFENMYENKVTGDVREVPQMPLQVVCYFHNDEPWDTVPILLHEMTHAVHGSHYGAMPLWLEEGLPNWFMNRKPHLGVQKKIDNLNRYPRHMKLVQEMDEERFIKFIASTQYEQWQEVIGDVGVGYFLGETLCDFFLGNPSVQPFFRQALAKTHAFSPWKYARSIKMGRIIHTEWPGGIAMLMKGWKSWYKIQAQPKKTNQLEPYLDANRKHFYEMVKAISMPNKVVTDTDRYALVSQWLAFKRLEMDDLTLKLNESYHHGESIVIRSRQWHVQQFVNKDNTIRKGITQDHRDNLIRTRGVNGEDPLYRKTVPYQPMSWYLGIDPVQGAHARPPYQTGTHLPPANFRWEGLDAWQANIIFTNLFTSHISHPMPPPKPKLKATAKGPFTMALRANEMNAEEALRAMGGKLERHPVTHEVITLNLARSRIDNGDLEHMAELFQPRVLDLTDTDITDGASKHLIGWASLRILKLSRTRMSTKAVENLKYYSPGLVIQ